MAVAVHRIGCHDVPLSPVMTYGIVLDGRYDLDALLDAFRILVRKWPLLSARISKNEHGDPVYLVPMPLADDGFTFTAQHHAEPLLAHFAIPRATRAAPSIHPQTRTTIFTPPAHLHHISTDAYASHSSQPMLHLALAAYGDDKTTIGVTAPHCLCDAAGMREIWAAWGAVLRDGEDAQLGDLEDTLFMERIQGDGQPPSGVTIVEAPPVAASTDVPDSSVDLAAAAAEDEDDVGTESHWVFFPNDYLKDLKDACNAELAPSNRWVSEGDILYAQWAKVHHSRPPLSHKANRQAIFSDAARTTGDDVAHGGPPVALMFPMDIRPRLPEFCRVFLHNANHFPAAVFPSAAAVAGQPLAQVALRIREAVEGSTPAEIRRSLALARDLSRAGAGATATRIPPGAASVVLSNWLKISVARRDTFAPARAAGSAGTGDVLWLDISSNARVGPDYPFGIMPRRDEAGVWMWFTLATARWSAGALGKMQHVA